jgi:chemotaxis protein methyltransferase CheR
MDHDVELSEEEFRLLRDFIHERVGIYFDESQRTTLRARLVGRLSSLDLWSFQDYYHYLRFGPQRIEEFDRMVSHITNNETYFFREPAQLKVLAEGVLGSLRERKSIRGDRSLKILSAGCSTGEEAHTAAMIVYDSGQFFWNWEVTIYGLDVDEQALEKARKGIYYHNAFRAMQPGLRERHFVEKGGGAQLKDAVRRMVSLRHGNIVEPSSYDDLAPLDVILCRNVLIYFSDSMILKAVRLFYDALAPGGYLLLGHAESLSRITDQFAPIRFPGAMVYQRPGGEAK